MRSLGQPLPDGSDDLHSDEAEWLDYRETRLGAPDISPLIEQADAVALRAQAALAQQHYTPEPPPAAPVAAALRPAGDGIQWPPGFAGVIARFIYERSYSPVKEVAITATLGLLAGVCGRACRTYTGKDLALYLILVARSGIGKDSTHEGIPMMLRIANVPMADRFVRAQDFVSGEALHKEVLREPGFLALQGEFGRKLKRMSNPTDTPMQTFRTVMTNAYGKQHLEGKSYSNADDSLLGVDWPALSFLGETTPGTFLECLTPDMMADGFLSRFLAVSYDGGRPPPNRERGAELDPTDHAYWQSLVGHMVRFQIPINTPPACPVEPNDDARDKLERFELQCIDDLNATDDESERQVWSRAHLKVLKVASLLAVADNFIVPVVRIEHVAWASVLVQQDIATFQSRKRSGDIGTGDNARERKLLAIMREYLTKTVPSSYKVPEAMRQNSVVPRSYLQVRVSSLPAFNDHKLGASRALDDALRSIVANGYVMEVDRNNSIEMYGFQGKTYRILRLPDTN